MKHCIPIMVGMLMWVTRRWPWSDGASIGFLAQIYLLTLEVVKLQVSCNNIHVCLSTPIAPFTNKAAFDSGVKRTTACNTLQFEHINYDYPNSQLVETILFTNCFKFTLVQYCPVSFHYNRRRGNTDYSTDGTNL